MAYGVKDRCNLPDIVLLTKISNDVTAAAAAAGGERQCDALERRENMDFGIAFVIHACMHACIYMYARMHL